MTQSILVIGSTGKQGNAVVRELLSDGWKVRSFTRNKYNDKLANIKDDNLEIFEGDLSNQNDLEQAMNDQYGVYCVQPIIQNDVEQELQQGKAIIDTAVKQNISYVVYSTAGGVNRNRTGPHFEALAKIEDMLSESPLNYTIIKPSFFMDNFLRIVKVEADNIYIPEFISPDIKFAMIPSEDIAKITAQIFKNVEEYNHQSIEIASDELTLNEVACTTKCAIRERMCRPDARFPILRVLWALSAQCWEQVHPTCPGPAGPTRTELSRNCAEPRSASKSD